MVYRSECGKLGNEAGGMEVERMTSEERKASLLASIRWFLSHLICFNERSEPHLEPQEVG